MTASALAASLERIGHVQAHLSAPASVLMAIIAIGASLVGWLWSVTQHVTTMAHEAAHAAVGSATKVPHGFWWWLWQLGAGAALVFGATLLV
jgi:hypothetical protein